MSIEHYLNKEKKGGCLMIYRKIIKYCEENNISIAALEKKCNIGNGTSGKWGKGGRPSLNPLKKISKVTGITVSELVSN